MPDIIKNDGTVERWDGEKLVMSLRRAGATEGTAQRIRHMIESTISATEASNQIYKRAFTMLRREGRATAARYSLRRSLFELGPTGHPFEDFVSELFKSEGWEVLPRQIIQGKCVPHEVDICAVRNGEHLAGELKYHNDPSYKTDVKVALYVKARLDDIWANQEQTPGAPHIDHGYLITNTKFTTQAIEYATCSGLNLLGWSYPRHASLFDRVVASGLYPITALTSLRKSEKRLLIDRSVSTTELLREQRALLRELGISAERIGAIMAEIDMLRHVPAEIVHH